MKLKYLFSLIAIVAISKNSFAQYANDAVRFSTGQSGSTSRIKAIGNAGTAVGGDLSSVSGNPAGLGFFTMSEASITPEYDASKINAGYLGNSYNSTKNNLYLNNAAVVFYTRLNTPRGQDKTKGWLSLNFGAGYSRTNNFGENIYYAGKNNTNTINDYYASLANSGGIDAGLAGWAYDHNLIDQYGTAGTYRSNAQAGVQQVNTIMRTGGQSEVNLSLGANYSNKLYLGFSLGITDLQYNSTNSFGETGVVSVLEGTPPTPVSRNYNSFYNQYQSTKGAGINAKFGAIYKILETVRVGATITTPTYITIDDVYTEELKTGLSSGNNYIDGPADYPLSYTMRTPFKAAGGASVFIGKLGFISGDVEYVDYSTTHIDSSDDFDSSYDNAQIKNNYRATVNARVGAEIRVVPSLMLRGGFGVLGSPLKNNGTSTKTATGGLGYRLGNYYVDATYQHITGSDTITPYTLAASSPSANLSRSNNNVFLTLGFRY
jgi:hypothetical protein